MTTYYYSKELDAVTIDPVLASAWKDNGFDVKKIEEETKV